MDVRILAIQSGPAGPHVLGELRDESEVRRVLELIGSETGRAIRAAVAVAGGNLDSRTVEAAIQ